MHKTTTHKTKTEAKLSCGSCKFSGSAKPFQEDLLAAEGRLHEQRVNRV